MNIVCIRPRACRRGCKGYHPNKKFTPKVKPVKVKPTKKYWMLRALNKKFP